MADKTQLEVDQHTLAVTPDWDPRSPEVLADQIAAYDEMRGKCPVAHGTTGNWAVFRHADVMKVWKDHQTYSNAVSRHEAVPNGMDPPEHTVVPGSGGPVLHARSDARVRTGRAGDWHRAGAGLAAGRGRPGDGCLGRALRGASPVRLHGVARVAARAAAGVDEAEPRRDTRQDREAMSAVAREFDGYIREQLEDRRAAGDDSPPDNTTALLGERVHGRALTDDEIVSIVRNWTVGELGTIAASVGLIAHFLARRPEVQARLRARPELAEQASDEILRIHPPLIANRRRTTRPVTVHGRDIPENERVIVVWASANRDEDVFGDPEEFRLDRDPARNLLYGAGIHYCPGAPTRPPGAAGDDGGAAPRDTLDRATRRR